MADMPVALDVYNYLEGFGINESVISEEWITNARDDEIIPFINHTLGFDIEAETEVTEYHSGNGTDILFLSRRNPTELVSIERVSGADITGSISLGAVELIADKGIIKATSGYPEYWGTKIFTKGQNNIKVVYKIGGTLTTELALAVKKLMCILALDNIADRTGGGNLTVQGFSRNHGDMGRYTTMRKRLNNQAMEILNRHKSAVIGS